MKLLLLDDHDCDVDEFELVNQYDLKTKSGPKQLMADILEAINTYPEEEKNPKPRKSKKKKAEKQPEETPIIH